MTPRYQSTKSVRGSGYNKYNGDKGYSEDSYDDLGSTPVKINTDFNKQYKRNMDLTNKAYLTNSDPKDFHVLNEIGLERAYNSPNYLYKNNDTLYMGGTQTARDVWDDLKIPFGLTRYSKRYVDADKVLQQDPDINRLVGHSLAGSVGLELQKNHPERNYKTVTYGAPVNSSSPSNERFRKDGDIVSFLDSGAQSYNKLTPDVGQHSYRGYS
jgi:hypothetical protein